MSHKQAVILIHGIGEQKPMDTLRRFVDAVWTRDAAIHDPNAAKGAHALLWSKPDTVSASFELRRLTTPQNTSGVTTDFFELYWAHLMTDTGYGHVLGWARSLLLRNPATVPKQLRLSYWLLVTLNLAAAALFAYAMLSGMRNGVKSLNPWLSAIASFALVPLGGFVVKNVVGDAARYLHVAPTNVQRRHEIRLAGVTLLRTLHERDYERIIVVGHSLGSVIGYDMLTHAWVDFHQSRPTAQHPVTAALDTLEAIAGAAPPPDVATIQSAQRAYMNELTADGNRWRVSDFVTLGSPLAHGAILLAKDLNQLIQKQADREFPTCPPTLETLTRAHQDVRRFSFELKPGNERVPHHAAVFAPTRWTNLYFPNSLIVKGDLIGGPLAPLFGQGIRDVAVSTTQWGGFFSHTLYWAFPESSQVPSHIAALRNALDLVDSRNPLKPRVGRQ